MKAGFLTLIIAMVVSLSWAGNNDNDVSTENANLVSLSGFINDNATNETLAGVKVTLEGTNQVAYTDFDGNFVFENIQPGVYNLNASYISYRQEDIEKLEVNNDENQTIEIRLDMEK